MKVLVDSSRMRCRPPPSLFSFTNASELHHGTRYCFCSVALRTPFPVHLAEWHGGITTPRHAFRIASILSLHHGLLHHGPWFLSIFFVSVLVKPDFCVYVFIPRVQGRRPHWFCPASNEQHEQEYRSHHHPPSKVQLLSPSCLQWSGCSAIDACIGVPFSPLALMDASTLPSHVSS